MLFEVIIPVATYLGAHDPRGYVGSTVDGAKRCQSKIW